IADRVGDAPKKSHPIPYIQLMALAVKVNGNAVDIFHHNVWKSQPGRTAIQQSRNSGMLEVCKDLALGSKPLQGGLAQQNRPHQLDRDLLSKLIDRKSVV